MKQFLLFIFIVAPFISSSQDAFTINNYTVKVEIDEFGDCLVTENFSIRFNKERRGLIRNIPLEGKFKNHRQKLFISEVNVEGENYKGEKSASSYNIKIGQKDVFIVGDKEYKIEFKASNGMLNFENHEEFYWTLIGPEWDADILNASFEIYLPKDHEFANSDIQLFSGKQGSTTSLGKVRQESLNVIKGQSLSTLGKGNGLTLGLRFPKGYFFENPDAIKDDEKKEPWVFNRSKGFPLPILLGVGLIAAFLGLGRRNNPVESIQKDYNIPSDMSSAEVGTFYDNNVNDRDIISLIPKWGQEGHIRVKVLNDQDLYLEKIKDLPEGATNHEAYFFESLFSDKNLVFLDELKYEFYQEFSKTKSLLKKDVDPGLYDEKAIKMFHSSKILWMGFGLIAVALISLLLYRQLLTGIGFALCAIIAFVIYNLEPKKSERGVRIHSKLQALYKFLEEPQPDILNEQVKSDPAYLEKIFPYVVAFGLEDNCADQFSALSEKGPDWYYYEDGRYFGYGDFHRDFDTRTISKTMKSVPVAPSSSSSFGGGGSTGGGFGGGGGSSW